MMAALQAVHNEMKPGADGAGAPQQQGDGSTGPRKSKHKPGGQSMPPLGSIPSGLVLPPGSKGGEEEKKGGPAAKLGPFSLGTVPKGHH